MRIRVAGALGATAWLLLSLADHLLGLEHEPRPSIDSWGRD